MPPSPKITDGQLRRRAWLITKESCDLGLPKCRVDRPLCGACLLVWQIVALCKDVRDGKVS